MPQVALALARFPLGLDVDVVAFFRSDLLQQEPAAEVGGQFG
jgi:hypothetical protein